MELKGKFIVFFLITSAFLLSNCSSDDSANNLAEEQEIVCAFNSLKFDFLDKTAFSGSILPTTNPTHFFEYDDGEIIKVNGGLTSISPFTGFNFTFVEEAFDSIIRTQNNIKIIHKGSSGFSNEVINFQLDNQNRIVAKTISSYSNPDFIYSTEEFIYFEGKILKIVNNNNASGNKTEQTFLFENGNLIKTETLIENFAGIVTKRRTDTFEDFDTFKNPFKELFFLNGAFYRSQSKNNYAKHTTIEETLNTNTNEWTETANYVQNYQFEYNEEGYPNVGEYNCN